MVVLDSPSSGEVNICVVGCLHGNEVFGQVVHDYIKARHNEFPGVSVILANEPAMKANRRYIDRDLNRAFPGSPTGDNEQRIAAELRETIKGFDYVLDFHTTTSPLRKSVAIVPNLGPVTKAIINASNYSELIHMEENLTASSLFGNVENAVSIELNEEFAKTPAAVKEVIDIINHLGSKQVQPRHHRRVYKVLGTIPLDVKLPADAANFELIPELGITPFLIYEMGYTQHQGFKVAEVDVLTY